MDFVEFAYDDPPVLDDFNNKKFEEEVTIKASFKSEKGGAFGGIVEKGDDVRSALLCLI